MTRHQFEITLHELRVHQVELEMQNEHLRATQAELEAAHQRFVELYDQAPVGYVTLSRQGSILAANLTSARLLRTERSRLLSKLFLKFVLAADRQTYHRWWRGLFAAAASRSCEVRLRPTKGSPVFYARLEGVKAAQESGPICRLTLSDITEQRRAEEALRVSDEKRRRDLAQANAQLEQTVRERTARLQELVGDLEHFSYTITHDLKSPLRAMRGFAEIATMMSGDSLRKQAKEALAMISTSAERMEALITDALAYSQSVRQELPLTDVEMGGLLRGMLDSYPDFQPSKARIQLEGRLPVVLGNEAGLTQCFSNLLGNAVKFVRPGERPQIRVWAQERDGWATIWVEDKGIGISKEMLPRVFDMFSRGSKDYEGTGIGLALVRKVTQRMGGKVGVESEEGKGSRFWMELRLGELRAKPGQVEAAAAEPKGGTVLYVEDEDSDAVFMKMAFAEKGMESALRVVGDGRAAIEYLSGAGKYMDRKQYPLPSVVLLDLNLPQVPAFEVLKWMRNHPDFARTPVVMFSSSMREDDRVKELELGANDFIGKPSSALKFGETVEGLRGKWMV